MVDFEFDPIRGTALWPNSSSEPNFHCKIFAPDETVATSGLAHSVYLKFLIFAIPAFGIAPGDFSLVGLLEDMANPSAFFCMFVGPRPGRRNAFYTLLAKTGFATNDRVVPLDLYPVRSDASSIIVEKYTGAVTDSPPSNSPEFQVVFTYVPEASPTYSDDGPMVSPYLYLDKTEGTNEAKSTDWFRVTQRLQSGVEFTSGAYRSQVWSEKSTFQALVEPVITSKEPREYAVRRTSDLANLPNGPLSATPLATFVTSDERFFSGQQDFAPGAWRFRIRGQSLDDSTSMNTHLMVRTWLVPHDLPSNATPEQVEAYRAGNEFCFIAAQGTDSSQKSTLKLGTPASLKEVMVSPPLDSELREYEIIRFIEATSAGEQRIQLPAGNWNVACGLYLLSEPTGDGLTDAPSLTDKECPRALVEFDPTYGYFETTLLVSQSFALFPVRWLRYNSSRFQPYLAPDDPYASLNFTRSRVYGGTVDGDEFAVYRDTVNAYDPNAEVSAFFNLATVRSGEQEATALCLPYSQIPEQKGTEGTIKADFCADEAEVSGGRVSNVRVSGSTTQAGTWKVQWSVNEDLDNESIAVDMRVEGFIVDSTGRITERVFRSPLVPFVSGTENYEFSTDITVPFVLAKTNTSRFILRVYAYPYSKNGSAVNLEEVQQALGTKPVGLRLTKLTIAEHTLETLQISQVASFLGSPAFYENLPIVPSRTIGGNEFWYIADAESLKFKIIIRPDTYRIQGTLYSPVWYVSTPKDTEVIVRAASLNSGIFGRQLWVRTVPGSPDGTVQKVPAFSAAGHPRTDLVHVAFNERGDVDDDVRGVEVLTHSAGVASPNWVGVVNDANGNKLVGTEASVFRSSVSSGDKSGSLVAVTTQFADSESPVVNIAASTKHGYGGSFRTPTAALDASTLSSPRHIGAGFKLHTTVESKGGDHCFVSGWLEGGALVLRKATLSQAQTQREGGIGDVYLVDGVPEGDMPFDQVPRPPLGGVSGTVNEDYSAVFVDAEDRPTVVYSTTGRDGELIGRRLEDRGFGRAYKLASFRQGGVVNSSDTPMLSPAAAYNEHYGSGVLVFWSNGRLFATRCPSASEQGASVLNPIYLVAGSGDFESGDTSDTTFAQLKATGYLLDLRTGDEDNVAQQRAGVTVLRDHQYYGVTAVYYMAANGDLTCRHLSARGTVGPAFKVAELEI
ncbi:MAG: hypothetical protein JSS66_04875 [Armatimonadetes bacterium]|nr:hypothetical protein [Armatimonadota bacterium]